MSSIVRRAASKLLKFIARTGDPGAEADRVIVYSKLHAGVTQLFAQTDDGTVHQLTPSVGIGREILPEVWAQNDVPAAQAATPLLAGVSQLFDDYQVIRSGSVVGLNVRFNAVLAAGSATAEVTVNGVGTGLTVVVTAPASSGRATQLPEIDNFAAGDLIGVTLLTAAGFLPSGSLDVECSVEIDT